MTPAGVRELTDLGHEVYIQAGAGVGSAITDEDYVAQGAQILPDADAVFETATMIVKVKEPQPVEVARLRPDHLLFTYLHLAPDPTLTQGLVDSGATCIAYETVLDQNGRLPLLAPMSEVAGKIATQSGAFILEKPLGGRGCCSAACPAWRPAAVMVIGGGVVGTNAAAVALGMGAEVYILDRNIDRLRDLEHILNGQASTCFATHAADRAAAARGRPRRRRGPRAGREGAARDHPRAAQADEAGAVLVDVSIDQGGCFETSHPTTHADPTYEVEASPTTASRTCRAPCRSRAPTRSRTRRCRTPSRSPRTACTARSSASPGCGRA